MLAGIFFLRLEASLRASEVAIRAQNSLFPALPVPTSEKAKQAPLRRRRNDGVAQS